MLAVGLDLKPTSKERRAITRALGDAARKCGSGMGWARFDYEPSEATLKVAGRRVPPGVTVILSAGKHDLVLHAEGFNALQKKIKIGKGKGLTPSLRLYRPGEAPVKKRKARRKKRKPRGGGVGTPVWPKWLTLGAGGLLSITAIGLGVSAGATADYYSSDGSMSIAAGVIGVIGVSALITGIVLVVTHDSGSKERVSWHPLLSPQTLGLGLSATF